MARKPKTTDKEPAPKPVIERTEADLGYTASMAEIAEVTADYNWMLDGLLLAPSVVLISGEQGSLKTYVAIDVCMRVIYGMQWHPKAAVGPKGMCCFYLTGENIDELPIRHRAWLKANDLPSQVGIEDDFIGVPAEPKAGGWTYSNGGRIDISNAEDIKLLGDELERIAKARGRKVGIVTLDTTTSLCPVPLARSSNAISRNAKTLALRLRCGVLLINHTHRNNAKKGQGGFALSANVDGDLVLERNRGYETNGVPLGLYTKLSVATRLKRVADNNLAWAWVGTPISLLDARGKQVETLAVHCIGSTDRDLDADKNSLRRLQLAFGLPLGSEISIASGCDLVFGGHGGVQSGWVKQALPDFGKTYSVSRDSEWRDLQRIRKGQQERLIVRAGKEPPKTAADKGKEGDGGPVIEPEAAAAMANKKAGKKAAYPTWIRCDIMPQAVFDEAMEVRITSYGEFTGQVAAMREQGAKLTAKGEALMKYLADKRNDTVANVTLYTATGTLRSIGATVLKALRNEAAQRRRKAKAAKGKKPATPPKPNDASEGPEHFDPPPPPPPPSAE